MYVNIYTASAEDLAEDFRYRSVTAALNRALHLWRRSQATPRQRQEGVDLSMIIQWAWPDVKEHRLADMMQWAGALNGRKVL